MAQCPECHKVYKKRDGNFSNHVKHCGRRYPCPHCPQTCCNPPSLQRHIRKLHPETLLNGGRQPSLIPEAKVSLKLEEPRRGTRRSAVSAFGEDDVLVEPSPKKLLEEDMIIPPPMFQNDVIEPASLKRRLVDYESSDEEDYFQSQGDGDKMCIDVLAAFEEPPCWAQYPGMPEEQFRAATQQMGGNPLFEFEVTPVTDRQWLTTASKTVYHTNLRQRRQPEDTDDIGVAIVNAMEATVRQHLKRINAQAQDRVFLAMTAHEFEHAYQSIAFPVHEFLEGSLRLDNLMQKLAGKLNSNEAFSPDQGFQLDLTLVRSLNPGSGHEKRLNPGRTGYKVSRETKKSLIKIKNKDELCCARAIVTMQARSEWKVVEKRRKEEQDKEAPDKAQLESLQAEEKRAKNDYERLRDAKGQNTRQLKLAKILHRQAGVPEGPCGLPELEKFQIYLSTQTPPYQLKVFTDIVKKPIFIGRQKADEDHILVLIKSNNHFDGCGSLLGFMNRSYWCRDCDKAFNTKDWAHHSCQGRVCKACGSKPCPDKTPFKSPELECPDCHGLFYGSTCFQTHKDKTICAKHKHCKKCSAEYQVIKGKPPHRCGFVQCSNCKDYVKIQEHKCYIQPNVDPAEEKEEEFMLDPTEELQEVLAEGKKTLPPLFVYADIEAMTVKEEGVRKFIPNLLCYQTSEEDQIHSISENNICLQFIQTLNQLARVKKKRERPVIVIFHNLKGFDGTFLIDTLNENSQKIDSQSATGAKVLCFQSGVLTFKDSLCFLSYSLAAFPKTFDLTELKKGYFPHQFNTPENQDYRGRIPDKEFYDPENMKEKEKKAFDTWHTEQVRRCDEEGYVFDFKKELEDYCKSDVALLKGGCEAFTEQFCKEADFNPFEKCMTIASACNLYWRRSIEPGSPASKIAVRPLRGWRGAQVNQSLVALQWLAYCESLIPKEGACADRIKHVKNGGEQKVRTPSRECFVDGLDPVTNTVYEFYGCLWHGCPHCYPGKRDMKRRVMPDRSAEEAYRATLKKSADLQKAGYHVVEIWECKWDRLVKQDPQIKAFINQLKWVDPLEPRDAFFGGRTGAVSLYANTQGDEEIHYADVTSLYPWVNKTQEYPLDHPEIITQPRQSLNEYFGLAKVDILPPTKLFHPVLPVRSGGKLTFPLCQACVQEQQAKPMLERSAVCCHTDQERMLRGTWCTPEIEKAIQVGYQLKRVHEVWHFQQRKSGLFKDYVNTWLKIKTEASGWPKECVTEEEKEAYLDKYERVEGITLERDKIQKNDGRKATAKLMLNSFWGKFGQRENLPQIQQCTNPADLYNLLEDDGIQISNLRICTDEVLEVVYTNVKDNVVPSNKTNVFIAAFTTCHARLKLYSYLETLQTQVLYYDTDSVIYKWAPGLPKLKTDIYLGDLKDELDGDHIVEFVSGGAKNYGYKTKQGKVECKVRGFTLNVRGHKMLNYESMKKHILAELENPQEERRLIHVTDPNFFVRDTTAKKVRLVERTKRYGLVFDKRVINPITKQSEPYGFRRVREEIDLLMDL